MFNTKPLFMLILTMSDISQILGKTWYLMLKSKMNDYKNIYY